MANVKNKHTAHKARRRKIVTSIGTTIGPFELAIGLTAHCKRSFEPIHAEPQGFLAHDLVSGLLGFLPQAHRVVMHVHAQLLDSLIGRQASVTQADQMGSCATLQKPASSIIS